MANEFKHKDPGSALTQAEFIASDGTGHIFESQAAGDILYASSSTVLARLAKATDGNVLQLASGLPAWAAAASGATTREGGNTTEATTTSTTVVDLITASSLTAAVDAITQVSAALRKTTGASAECDVGIKINTTTVFSALEWTGDQNEAISSFYMVDWLNGLTNYLKAGRSLWGSFRLIGGNTLLRAFATDMPAAEATSFIIPALTDSASITMAIDSLHVYTKSVA